jgi:arabinose-5-phosphate isomerase
MNFENSMPSIVVLQMEAAALITAAERLGDSIERAADIILSSRGKVIIAGLGKSGHIAQKITATLRSVGCCSAFLHATEAVHGDLGLYQPGDVTIMLSKSGTTPELFQLLPILRKFESPIIGILGNVSTGLASEVDCVIDASVTREADPLNIAPTSSSTLTLALGDALAATLMHRTGFTHDDFAVFHPGGQLGKNLGRLVENVMHREVMTISSGATLKEAVIALSHRPLGAVCVVDDDSLVGIITDGDVRRAIERDLDIKTSPVQGVMKRDPVTIHPSAPLNAALELMENRSSQISVLPVVSKSQTLVGLIRLHDIYQVND